MSEFRDRVLSALKEREMSQADLAAAIDRYPQYVSQLLRPAPKRSVTPQTVRRIAHALRLRPEVLYPGFRKLAATASIKLHDLLEQRRRDLGASSCTFYLRDPYWSHNFRIAALCNVRYEEPMYGFASPSPARDVILGREQELFVSDTSQDSRLSEPPISLTDVDDAVLSLFGDFQSREGVRASARLTHTSPQGEPEAILFVNFSQPTEFDLELRTQLRALLREAMALTGAVQIELADEDDQWMSEATQIVSPELSLPSLDLRGAREPDAFFQQILESTLRALGLSPEMALGTLHLYDPELQLLTLHGHCGHIQNIERARTHSVKRGEGVVSWVVMRRRALLIQNLRDSDFGTLHVTLNEATCSELAVPIESAGTLVGVICLECFEPGRLLPHHVRSVWYAANRAAIVYRMHQQAQMNSRLLSVCAKAATGSRGAHDALEEIATLARTYLRSTFCDIWSYDADKGSYVPLAGADRRHHDGVRRNGFTDYVRRCSEPIWISRITGPDSFALSHWRNGSWQDTTLDAVPLQN